MKGPCVSAGFRISEDCAALADLQMRVERSTDCVHQRQARIFGLGARGPRLPPRRGSGTIERRVSGASGSQPQSSLPHASSDQAAQSGNAAAASTLQSPQAAPDSSRAAHSCPRSASTARSNPESGQLESQLSGELTAQKATHAGADLAADGHPGPTPVQAIEGISGAALPESGLGVSPSAETLGEPLSRRRRAQPGIHASDAAALKLSTAKVADDRPQSGDKPCPAAAEAQESSKGAAADLEVDCPAPSEELSIPASRADEQQSRLARSTSFTTLEAGAIQLLASKGRAGRVERQGPTRGKTASGLKKLSLLASADRLVRKCASSLALSQEVEASRSSPAVSGRSPSSQQLPTQLPDQSARQETTGVGKTPTSNPAAKTLPPRQQAPVGPDRELAKQGPSADCFAQPPLPEPPAASPDPTGRQEPQADSRSPAGTVTQHPSGVRKLRPMSKIIGRTPGSAQRPLPEAGAIPFIPKRMYHPNALGTHVVYQGSASKLHSLAQTAEEEAGATSPRPAHQALPRRSLGSPPTPGRNKVILCKQTGRGGAMASGGKHPDAQQASSGSSLQQPVEEPGITHAEVGLVGLQSQSETPVDCVGLDEAHDSASELQPQPVRPQQPVSSQTEGPAQSQAGSLSDQGQLAAPQEEASLASQPGSPGRTPEPTGSAAQPPHEPPEPRALPFDGLADQQSGQHEGQVGDKPAAAPVQPRDTPLQGTCVDASDREEPQKSIEVVSGMRREHSGTPEAEPSHPPVTGTPPPPEALAANPTEAALDEVPGLQGSSAVELPEEGKPAAASRKRDRASKEEACELLIPSALLLQAGKQCNIGPSSSIVHMCLENHSWLKGFSK